MIYMYNINVNARTYVTRPANSVGIPKEWYMYNITVTSLCTYITRPANSVGIPKERYLYNITVNVYVCHKASKLYKESYSMIDIYCKSGKYDEEETLWIWQMAFLVKYSSPQFFIGHFPIICKVKNCQSFHLSIFCLG
jgi:hypothetical protein